MNISNLNSFLELGYFLDYESELSIIDNLKVDNRLYNSSLEYELIEYGSNLIKESISKLLNLNSEIVVPLSGGLDSRVVLAALVEHINPNSIHTYTFGIPGGLDYEIGGLIAKQIGTKHQNINLNEYFYTLDELLDVSNRIDGQSILFYHDPISILTKDYLGFSFWKGFLGETLTGSHYPKNPKNNLFDAKKSFIKKNKIVNSIDLKCPNVSYQHLIRSDSLKNEFHITIEEQLDLNNRQLKYIAPHVMMKGYDYRLPFMDGNLQSFFLSLDPKFRKNQYLYKKILLNTFPDLFNLPTSTNKGLSLRTSKIRTVLHKSLQKILTMTIGSRYKRVNYFNFCERLNKDLKFSELVFDNINDLIKRSLIDWIDINEILKSHRLGKKDHHDALLVLCSLEIHLKNNKSI